MLKNFTLKMMKLQIQSMALLAGQKQEMTLKERERGWNPYSA